MPKMAGRYLEIALKSMRRIPLQNFWALAYCAVSDGDLCTETYSTFPEIARMVYVNTQAGLTHRAREGSLNTTLG